jgi:hypothetical protein
MEFYFVFVFFGLRSIIRILKNQNALRAFKMTFAMIYNKIDSKGAPEGVLENTNLFQNLAEKYHPNKILERKNETAKIT